MTLLVRNGKSFVEAHEGDGIKLIYPRSELSCGRVRKGISPTIPTRSGGCNEPKLYIPTEGGNKTDIEKITIRKLTEREALSLQGFTEEADTIVDAKDEKGKRMFPMTACYIFAGNAVCVNAF